MAKDKHHYVPQGYLRGFTIEGEKSLIWEYDKNTGKAPNQPRSIRDVCAKHHYYAQKNEDGSVDNISMENAFQEIEDKAPRVIKRIELPGTGKKVSLTEEEREILSFFAAIQLCRVPNFRDGIEQTHQKIVEITLDHLIEKDLDSGTLPKGIEDLHKAGEIQINVEHHVSLEPMIDMAKRISAGFLKKVWHFAAPAKDMTFVTSDNPVYFQAQEKYRDQTGSHLGPVHPFSEVTLPLRKDLLIIFCPSHELTPSQYKILNCTSIQLDNSSTKNFNKRTTLSAAQYVYSSQKSEALARMIGKYKGTSQRIVV